MFMMLLGAAKAHSMNRLEYILKALFIFMYIFGISLEKLYSLKWYLQSKLYTFRENTGILYLPECITYDIRADFWDPQSLVLQVPLPYLNLHQLLGLTI